MVDFLPFSIHSCWGIITLDAYLDINPLMATTTPLINAIARKIERRLILFLKLLKKITIIFTAKLTNKRFYCNALNGLSDYSISVLCDMSVSCNAMDFDRSGYIGDLSKQSLTDIFNGPIVKKFRKKLANGILPTITCSRCIELRIIDKNDASYYEQNFTTPHLGIKIENTSNCNLNCLSCSRLNVSQNRTKTSLSLEDIKKLSLMLKEHNIALLSYYNLGEPFLSSTIYEELKILRKHNPNIYIHISTNGFLLDQKQNIEAALLIDHITFSIDGIDNNTVQKYQQNGSFQKSYNNMKDLVKYRNSKGLKKPEIEWKYVLFNWNDKKDMIYTAIDSAKQANVDLISFWPTITPLYGISWRYFFGNYFNTIGTPSQDHSGREIIF